MNHTLCRKSDELLTLHSNEFQNNSNDDNDNGQQNVKHKN